MSEANDDRLRKAMQDLRADDASRAPDFRAMADRREPPRALASRVGPIVGSLAVAAAVLAVWVSQREAAAPPPMAAAASPAAPAADLSGGSAPVPHVRAVAPSRDDVAPLDFLLGEARGALASSSANASSLDFLVTKDLAR